MSFETACLLIEQRLETEWGSTTPIAWDNKEYIPERGKSFIRPVITQTLSTLTTPASYGRGNYREYGLITVQVFVQKNLGAGASRGLADQVANIFRGYSEDRLYIHESRIVRIGQSEEWYQHNAMIDFYYDHCLELA